MCLSLDHHTLGSHPQLPPLDSQLELDSHLHNVRSGHNARNRWFDKTFSVIVESNTRSGAMGEHSPVDALVPSIVTEYALVQRIEMDAFDQPLSATTSSGQLPSCCKRLDWVVDDHIEKECQKAEERAKAIIDDSDDSVLWFTDYGTDWIKEVGTHISCSN
jgi:carnitine O-acetyltransferase